MQTLSIKIKGFQEKYILGNWRYAIVLLYVAAYIVYYFPLYGTIWINSHNLFLMGDKLYNAINPFKVAPYFSGLFLLWICVMHRDIILKVFFYILYLTTLGVSLYYITGITTKSEYVMYLPFIIIVFFCGGLIINNIIEYRKLSKFHKQI